MKDSQSEDDLPIKDNELKESIINIANELKSKIISTARKRAKFIINEANEDIENFISRYRQENTDKNINLSEIPEKKLNEILNFIINEVLKDS